MISAEGLVFDFGARRAVDGLSLKVVPGTCFGLLGPNGAGKTTSIRMLTGTLAPAAGRVLLEGRLDPRQVEAKRLTGLAPQALALYDELSALENLAFLGRFYGLRGKALRSRCDAVLDLVGLRERAKDPAGSFSGGMKRRLNLACALVHGPKLLVLDEPTVGVDPQSRNHIFDNVEALKSKGLTILYTTHYMEEAERLCDQVAIMDEGKILAEGTVEELKRAHGGKPALRLRGKNGEESVFFVEDPAKEVPPLLARQPDLESFEWDRPNLEQVFLNLTGRKLRDA
ncbi:MAG TPA: ABC transporter ATP-binding protein [Planctomycetes bacterium]|nr:ABC transporter ATP-binding protein [Planctomycetota bacterium]